MRIRTLLVNLALFCVGLSFALALAEFTVRALESRDLLPGERDTELFPEVEYSGKFKLSTNKVLIFELDPENPLINSDGFRDREFPVAKSEVKRIMMLGDSVTFGRGVPLESTFPKLLEQLFNRNDRTGRRYEVMNVGVPGYNTRQELEFFEVKGRKYAPDLLVITWILNDCWPADMLLNEFERIKQAEAETGSDPAAGSPSPRAPAANEGESQPGTRSALPPEASSPLATAAPAVSAEPRGLLARSRLIALVRDRVGRATSRRPRDWLPLERICAVPQNWKLVSRSFAEFARIAAHDRFPVAVVIFPMLVDFEHYPYHRLHQRVARVARRNGFAVLDLFESFESHDAAELQLLPGDTTHPGTLGHRLAAERIYTFLRQAGLPRKTAVAPRPPPG